MYNKIKRTFILGEEWLFLKLYTGYKTADTLIVEVLPNILEELVAQKVLHKWFFIRYSDPHFHLRLRFYIPDKQMISVFISSINRCIADYVAKDLIWKVQFDTYQRELERYGYSTIEYSENIFEADSIAIVGSLEMLKHIESSEQKRWLIALKMIDSFLDDFEYEIFNKHKFLTNLSENFKLELGIIQKGYKIHVDKKYRTHRYLIEEIMNIKEDSWIIAFMPVIQNKSQKIKENAKILLKLHTQNNLNISINDLLGSHIHMMINRLFRSRQRLIELVLYDFLIKYYSGAIAQNKYMYSKVDNRYVSSHEEIVFNR